MMEMEQDYPPQVAGMVGALAELPGVSGVRATIQSLNGVSAGYLGQPHFAGLPHGALLRTGGGQEHEALVQFEFYLEQNEDGWRSLEFLAWYVRDAARSGSAVQLRPFALPPVSGTQVQLGQTLRFQLDLFCPGVTEDLDGVLNQIYSLTKTLKLAQHIYREVLWGE